MSHRLYYYFSLSTIPYLERTQVGSTNEIHSIVCACKRRDIKFPTQKVFVYLINKLKLVNIVIGNKGANQTPICNSINWNSEIPSHNFSFLENDKNSISIKCYFSVYNKFQLRTYIKRFVSKYIHKPSNFSKFLLQFYLIRN